MASIVEFHPLTVVNHLQYEIRMETGRHFQTFAAYKEIILSAICFV